MTGPTDGLPLVLVARRILAEGGPVEALLIRNGRVVAAGDAGVLRSAEPGAATLELPDLVVTPGLTDAHVHLVEWALARRQPPLGEADSPAEAAAMMARHVDEHGPGPGGWVRARGWDPLRWSEPAHRRLLDEALGDTPVALESHDMHSCWASTAALRAAGIDAGTADPEGGRIERDADGEPTGVLRDNAIPLLLAAVPDYGEAERREALQDAQTALHAMGITGVHTVEPDSLGLLERVRADGDLRLRVLQHLPLAKLDDAIRLGLRSGFGGPWLRIGGVKMFLDGALGSRTAWLREPYEGTESRGLSTLDPAAFQDAVARGAAAGLATTVHAIGDAAVDLALDTLADHVDAPGGAVPHRIEHAQLVAPDRLGRAPGGGPGDAGDGGAGGPGASPVPEPMRRVVLSVQPCHLMTDWRAADRHWGDRARWAFALRTMEAAGFTLALGSDAPVEPPDPRHGLWAAVARRDLDGAPDGGWHPEQALSMERAWRGYTTGPAAAAGDPRQGRLAPGSFADLVAWTDDPLETADPRTLEPVLTMVDGDVIWRA